MGRQEQNKPKDESARSYADRGGVVHFQGSEKPRPICRSTIGIVSISKKNVTCITCHGLIRAINQIGTDLAKFGPI